MRLSTFLNKVERIIEDQGGERFVALALDEFELPYVDDITPEHRAFFLGRCVALWEEDQ